MDAGRRAADAPPRARLNLSAVEGTLKSLQGALEETDALPVLPRDTMDDRVVENLLAAYAAVGGFIAQGLDLFAMGQLRNILELNALVLCGANPLRREAYNRHLAATEHRFYEEPGGGIQGVVEWYAANKDGTVWERAAGVYVRTLGMPQLFIEGNHRTGAILMSYVLLRDGEPPFVLSPGSAREYFAVSAELRSLDRGGPVGLLRVAAVRQRLAALLLRHADSRYLSP